MRNAPKKHSTVWPVVVFGATLLVIFALLIKLFLSADVDLSLVIAITGLTGLLLLSPRLFEIVELTVSKEGLVAKIQDVETRVAHAEQNVRETEKKVDRIFAYTMSDSMFANLGKLASGRFGRFKNDGGLRRELRHLRDIGYVAVNRHIGDLPDAGEELSDFVSVTPVGREFVELRAQLERSQD